MSTDEHPPAGGATVPGASGRSSGADDRGTDRRPPLAAADARSLLRDRTPIVCVASRRVFEQEADYLRALSDVVSRPVPRISVKIVPDPAAADASVEEREPAKAPGRKDES